MSPSNRSWCECALQVLPREVVSVDVIKLCSEETKLRRRLESIDLGNEVTAVGNECCETLLLVRLACLGDGLLIFWLLAPSSMLDKAGNIPGDVGPAANGVRKICPT